MKKNMKDILIMIFITFIAMITIGVTNRCTECDKCKTNEPIEIVKKDTVEIHDTIFFDKPIPQLIEKIRTDTIFINDTIFVELPIEQKTYSDSSTYTIQISGFETNLDHIEVYPKTTYIMQEKVSYIERKQPYFALSSGVGYGIFSKKVDLWFGVTYSIPIRF